MEEASAPQKMLAAIYELLNVTSVAIAICLAGRSMSLHHGSRPQPPAPYHYATQPPVVAKLRLAIPVQCQVRKPSHEIIEANIQGWLLRAEFYRQCSL
jgi:hypothetical protein